MKRWFISILVVAASIVPVSANAVELVGRVRAGFTIDQIASEYRFTILDRTEGAPFALIDAPDNWAPGRLLNLMRDARFEWIDVNVRVSSPDFGTRSKGSTIPIVGTRSSAFSENVNLLNQIGYSSSLAEGRNRSVRVAVLDTGLSPFAPELWANVVASANFVESGPAHDLPVPGTPSVGAGHGTMVAGLINLLAPNARFVIARVANSEGVATNWTVIRGIAFAAVNGAQVVNISLGTSNDLAGLDGVIRWAESERSMFIVAPIGNEGLELTLNPAAYGRVLCVSGVDPSDLKAEFSNFSGRANVAAPATGVRSTFWNGNLATWSGTSFAAPLASGALALGLGGSIGDSVPGTLLSRLSSSGDLIDNVNPAFSGKLGRRLNVGRFIQNLSQ